MKKILLFSVIFLLSSWAFTVQAANVGDVIQLNVDKNYDATARSKVQATLIKATSSLYFYVETDWWLDQTITKRNSVLDNLEGLSVEFGNKIYPTLTSLYGSEPTPGIDNDPKITVLFEISRDNLGGYFRSANEYDKLQAPDSNQREMVYLPIAQIDNPQLKVFLAHEFTHLIVFNQKEKLRGVSEEVWLDEARADFASTILGYDDVYEGSNLQRRVSDFLVQPNDSLTEWQGTKYDYAVDSVFMHYLVDHYGVSLLADSLNSQLVGIPSINEALSKSGAKETFAQIFTNWTIATVINNCSLDAIYCYTNPNLKNLKISPNLIFLPLAGESSLSMNNTIKNWMGNWQKIVGGNGDLTLQFSSFSDLNFSLPYIVYDKNNNYTVNFLKLDNQKKGKVTIKSFGTKYNSLVVMPSLQTKMLGFSASELAYPYTFTVSIAKDTAQDDSAQLQRLLDQLADIKEQIARLQTANGQIPEPSGLCPAIASNLYVGVANRANVTCLQQFLKMQGVDIYPQGLVTGTFGNLTKMAVIEFQKKYNIPQTGFVGILTRAKINQMLSS